MTDILPAEDCRATEVGMPSGVSSRPALAAAIVVVLLAGIAVAVVQPGDLGGDGALDAAGPTTTTTVPSGAPAPEPGGTETPESTVPAPAPTAGGDGPAITPAPPIPTTTPVPGAPAPTTTAPASGSDPRGESQPRPTLADTGGSDVLAPLAAALLLAGTLGRRASRP